jgi:hypothetical protein
MKLTTLYSLRDAQLITEAQQSVLSDIYLKKIFSLFYELRTMLYLGVLLFTTGVGILVYKNIDTIGHQIIIALLVLFMAGCFWYVNKKKLPYTNAETQSPGTLYDYMLLLGALLFAIIIAYLQFQYSIFGEQWGLGALIPALAYFPLAYRFDHRGVLSLGITGLASWLGLTVSPVGLMKESIFPKTELVNSGLLFGAAMMAVGLLLEHRNIKKHFTFTYMSFGFLVFGVACLGGLFTLDRNFIFFILTIALCALGIYYARKEQSFFFLLMSALFGYVAVTYLLIESISDFAFWQLYVVVSCGAMVYGLFKYKTLLRKN